MDEKLTFRRDLYLGEGIKPKKLDKIKRKLVEKPLLAGVYVISIAGNPEDQLEIFDAKQLAQSYYKKFPRHVVGIASDYDDSLKLIERITQECLRERGDCNLKEYLLC